MRTDLPIRTQAVAFIAGILALASICVASVAVAYIAFDLYYLTPDHLQREDWWGVVLNRIAPAVSGILVALILCAGLRRFHLYESGRSGHLWRAWSWYAVLGLLVWHFFEWHDNPDYGFYGQLTEWPAVALAAAILVDILASAARSPRTSRDAA